MPRLALLGLCALAACSEADHHTVALTATTDDMAPTIVAGDEVHYDPHKRDLDRGDLVVVRSPCAPEVEVVARVVAVGGESVEIRCDRLYLDGDPTESDLATGARYHDELGGIDFDTLEDPDRAARDRARDALAAEQVTYEAFRGPRDFPGAEPPRCPAADHRTDAQRGVVVARTEPSLGCGKRGHLEVPEDTVFVLGDNRLAAADSRTWGPVPLDLVDGEVASVHRAAAAR